MTVLLGAIADDFTGATDLANTLVKQGMRATQVIGVPNVDTDIGDAQAVIVALKSRTEPTVDAVEKSLAALNWLRSVGAQQIFFKYCSTFDSTAKGNIGPVADALLTALNSEFAIVCPAFPTNARTIYKGNLFVGDLPLNKSSMKDHPLTPMSDANLQRLMDAQSTRKTGLVPLQKIREGKKSIISAFDTLKKSGYSYAVVDAVSDNDLITIGQAVADHSLITGGSGGALGLPDNFRVKGMLSHSEKARLPETQGRQLVLAGSCSTATRGQIDFVRGRWPNRKINVDDIAAGKDVSSELVQWAMEQDAENPILIFASSDPQEITEIQEKYGVDESGAMVERIMGELAIELVEQGFSPNIS